MAKQFFKNLPDTSTPLTAPRLNGLLDGDESQGNLVVESISSKNIFDKNNVVKGYLYTSTGDIYADSDRFISIPYIKVEPNANYTFSATNVDIFRFIEYDSSKNFIQRQIAPTEVNSKTYTTSATTQYVRISCNISNLSSLQLEKGSTATTYTPYNAYGSKNLKDENIVVGSIRSKNMFGNYTIINGWIYGTGMRVNTENGNRMAFVKCEPNTTYTISRSVLTGTFRVGDYTSIPIMTSSNVDYTLPKAIVEDNGATSITYTTSSTAQYLIVHYGTIEDTNLNESLVTIQAEEGSTATAYSPYQNLSGEEIYSTVEVKIGTWIDGKPLYRKVFESTTYATSFNVPTQNIERLVSIQGMLQRSDFPDIYEPIPSRLDNAGMSSQFGIITKGNSTNINVILGSNWQNVFNRIVFILEYTKTTD